MSYYKYAERTSDRRVDWSAISKNMVDMLETAEAEREKKLDAAVVRQDAITTKISEAPSGSDATFNATVAGMANDTMEYGLMLKRLWQTGKLSYREYMAATANVLTNTQSYFAQATNYADSYEKHMERMRPDENGFIQGSRTELDAMARVEGFGDFSRFTPVWDAPTGNLALVGPDGTNYASVAELSVAVRQEWNRLPLNGLLEQQIEALGARTIVTRDGRVETLESALAPSITIDELGNRVEGPSPYSQVENDIIGIALSYDDNATTSVLSDYSRGNFSTGYINDENTLSAAAQENSTVVVMVPHPSDPTNTRYIGSVEDAVSDEDFADYIISMGVEKDSEQYNNLIANRQRQKQLAETFVRSQMRSRIDWTETPQEVVQPRPPTAEMLKFQQQLDDENEFAGHWLNLFAGDENAMNISRAALVGRTTARGKVIDDIQIGLDNVTVFFEDGDKMDFPKMAVGEEDILVEGVRVPGERMGLFDWATQGESIHGLGRSRIKQIANKAGFLEFDEEGNLKGISGAARDVETGELIDPQGARGGIEQVVPDFNNGTVTMPTVSDQTDNKGKITTPKGTPREVAPVAAFDERVAGKRGSSPATSRQAAVDVMTTTLNAGGRRQLADETRQIQSFDTSDLVTRFPDLKETLDGMTGVVRFYIPSLMDNPIFLPIQDKSSARNSDFYMRALVQDMLKRANSNVAVTDEDIQRFISSIQNEGYEAATRAINETLVKLPIATEVNVPVGSMDRPPVDAPRPVPGR